MSNANLGPLRIDPEFPDAALNAYDNWNHLGQHMALIQFVAAGGGTRARRYVLPGFKARYTYDIDDNLETVTMCRKEIGFLYILVWEDAGGGDRPLRILYFLDDGSGDDPDVSPDDLGYLQEDYPEIGVVGGGYDFMGWHGYQYSGTSPDDFTGVDWNASTSPPP